ncbi:MAG: signal peptidase I [Sarcina sp.]
MEYIGSGVLGKRSKIKKRLVFVFFIILSLCIYISIGFTYVVGKSMESTMKEGEILLVNRLYKEAEVKRGDIAILDIEYEGKKTRVIKRIIAKSGDVLEITNNSLYINDIKVNEPYIKEKMNCEDQKYIVPQGKVFIMGDNRNVSLDSRNKKIGYIDFETSIYGKVVFSISDWQKKT